MNDNDWRSETLEQVRRLIHDADPGIVEERKWKKPSNPSGVPTWSHGGIICTGETYNSSLEGSTRRAIDIHEGDKIDEDALKALIREAVAANLERA